MPYVDNGGTRLFFDVRGSGDETIVLVPGLGLSGAAWGAVADLLAARHRVVIPDPRGSGASAKPDAPYTGDIAASDLLAVLDAAEVQHANVVGLSMGGLIAQDFVVRHPRRVRSLVLLSTYGAPDEWFRRLFSFRRRLIAEVGLMEHYRIFVMLLFSPFAFRSIPDRIRAIEESLAANPPDEAAYVRQIDYCLQHDARDGLQTLRIPTLVITGSHDTLTPVPLGTELASTIPGARYHQIQGASHGLWLEAPEEIAALCEEFVQTTEPVNN